jgi:hypothetical protein
MVAVVTADPWDRFADKIDAGVCMEWTGAITNGYGRFQFERKCWLAHRWVWTQLFGPIPDDMTVDHICRNTRCVDPSHLRLLPMYDNIMAGYATSAVNRRKTHCNEGHEFTPENTHIKPSGHRVCLTCKRAYERQYRAARRAAA